MASVYLWLASVFVLLIGLDGTTMAATERVRAEPRISVTKLGEYLTATPRRRRAIIRAQHRPKDSIVARYHDARAAITRFLIGELGEDGLVAERDRIAAITGGTSWAIHDRRLSGEAITRFLDLADRVVLHGLPRLGSEIVGALRVHNVTVSVRPDVVVSKVIGSVIRRGSIKLVFTRDVPVSEESGAYIGTALAEHLISRIPGDVVVRDWCQVVDVMSGTIKSGPKTYRSRLADIEAACEEIASSWPRLVLQ